MQALNLEGDGGDEVIIIARCGAPVNFLSALSLHCFIENRGKRSYDCPHTMCGLFPVHSGAFRDAFWCVKAISGALFASVSRPNLERAGYAPPVIHSGQCQLSGMARAMVPGRIDHSRISTANPTPAKRHVWRFCSASVRTRPIIALSRPVALSSSLRPCRNRSLASCCMSSEARLI